MIKSAMVEFPHAVKITMSHSLRPHGPETCTYTLDNDSGGDETIEK